MIALVIAVGLSILGITLLPTILLEFFPKYSDAVTAIQIVSITIVPAAIAHFYTSKLLGMEKSKTAVISRALKAITVIVGILLLAPTFKIIGLSVAFVLSAIIETVFLVLSYHLWIKRST